MDGRGVSKQIVGTEDRLNQMEGIIKGAAFRHNLGLSKEVA
jgi:hypothetical protein